jgi:hypothetical protein
VFLVLNCGLLLFPGCGVHHYDAETGIEHLWGFGHLRMKAPAMADGPVVAGTDMIGLNVSAGSEQYGVGIGLDSRSRVTVPSDGKMLSLEWPTNVSRFPRAMRDLFIARIGEDVPPALKSDEETAQGRSSP